MINEYDFGDAAVLRGTFMVSGSYANPSTVALKYKDPAGNVTNISGSFDNPSVGIWEYAIIVNQVGQWYYRWEGYGAVEAKDENYLIVKPSEFD